jgi:hypothetical protein
MYARMHVCILVYISLRLPVLSEADSIIKSCRQTGGPHEFAGILVSYVCRNKCHKYIYIYIYIYK